MALFLAHGKLVYTFNVADQRVRIKSEDKYNDGAWHSVSLPSLYVCKQRYLLTCVLKRQLLLMPKVTFTRDGSVGRLIIDGLTVLEDRVQGSGASWHISSPLYVGGVPPGRAQRNVQVQVKVCCVEDIKQQKRTAET